MKNMEIEDLSMFEYYCTQIGFEATLDKYYSLLIKNSFLNSFIIEREETEEVIRKKVDELRKDFDSGKIKEL